MSEHEKLKRAIDRVRGGQVTAGLLGAEAWVSVPYAAFVEVCRAAESTLPKTKMVEVWRVEWAGFTGLPQIEQFDSKTEADRYACMKSQMGRRCIRVTGPHQQEVPA